jgi:hypothetical protein
MTTNADILDSLARLNLSLAEEAAQAQDYNCAAKALSQYVQCVDRGAEIPRDGETRAKAVRKFLMW